MKIYPFIDQLYEDDRIQLITVKHPMTQTEQDARRKVNRFGKINAMDISKDKDHTLFRYFNFDERIIISAMAHEHSYTDPDYLNDFNYFGGEPDEKRQADIKKLIKKAVSSDGAELITHIVVDKDKPAQDIAKDFDHYEKTRVAIGNTIHSAWIGKTDGLTALITITEGRFNHD